MESMFSKTITMVIGCWLFAGCAGNNNGNTQQQVQKMPVKVVANNGEVLFEDNCTTCHGADGTAGIANAANLMSSRLDSATVIKTITEGKKAMPAFKKRLNRQEIAEVANYVHSLRK
jgi:cytochrome c6